MSELEFNPAEYRPERVRRGHSDWRDWDEWRPAMPSAWLVLTLGVLAGAAAAYYLYPDQGGRPRYRDSAPRRVARDPGNRGHAITGRTVTVARPRAEVYAFWRKAENLSFMENVERVERLDDRRQRWTIAAPGGRTITLETEIVEERENEYLAWRSVEGSDVHSHGHVTFRDAPGDRGTEISAEIEYVPPGGTVGQIAAKLFQREPAVQVRHDLKRLKMLLEAGEIATNRNRKNAA